MVLEMEKQMRALNDRMSRTLAADEEAASVDTFFVDPFRSMRSSKMDGIISRQHGAAALKQGKV